MVNYNKNKVFQYYKHFITEREHFMEKEPLLEEDIVAMLDHFMAKGGGHMNVDVAIAKNTTPANRVKHIKETKSLECNSKQMACQVPTLQEGLDQED